MPGKTLAMKCSSPVGCKNPTTDPSGLCHVHVAGGTRKVAAGSAYRLAPPGIYSVESAEQEFDGSGMAHATGGYDAVRINAMGNTTYTTYGTLHRADGASVIDADGNAAMYHYMGQKYAGPEGAAAVDMLARSGAAPEDLVRWLAWDTATANDLVSQRITADEADAAEADGVSGPGPIAEHAKAARKKAGASPCAQEGCGRVTTSPTGRCHDHVEGDATDTTVTEPMSAKVPDSSSAPEMAMARAQWKPSSPQFERTMAVMDACRATGKTAIMMGEPGTGKTSLIEALAAEHGMGVETLIGSQMDPTDLAGLPTVTRREDGMVVTEYGMPDWGQRVFDRAAAGQPSVLFFDEASNTPPATQSAILTLLQSRTVQGRKLPEDCWIVAAANPLDSAADGWTMSAPMANRLMHLTWDPPVTDWYEGMNAAFGKDVTPRESAERATVVSFLKSYPSLVQARPDNEIDAAGAWPSRRSWDNLATTLSKTDNEGARAILTEGFVGQAAAVQFATWKRSLDLPDPQAVLDDPSSVDWKASSADRTHAILGSVLGMASGAGSGGASSLDKAVDVYVAAGKGGAADVAAASVQDLLGAARKSEGGTAAYSAAVAKLLPVFTETLQKAEILKPTKK